MRGQGRVGNRLSQELTTLRQRIAELEALHAGRERAEEALRKSEATAQALLESAAEGIVIVGSDGRIVLANARAAEMFGTPREELIGQPMEVLLPERLRAAHTTHRAGYFTEPRIRPMGRGLDLAGRRKDGTEFPVEISLSYNETEDGLVTMAFITDIAQRKHAEWRQNTQFAVTRVFAESGQLEDAIAPLLRAICEGLGWEVGELWYVDPATKVLRWGGIWHAPSLDVAEFEAVSRQITLSHGSGLPGRVWATGEPAWIADILTDADFHRTAVAAKMGLHGALAFPVWSERGVTGIMVFFSRHVHPPDQDLLKIMADIGSRIGQFIKRKRGEEALTRQAEELARLGQEAQVREAFIRNVVESIQDGIIVLDRQGRITEWNRAMEERYGIPAAEVRGLSILEVFPSLRAEGFEESLGRILGGTEEVTLERWEHETRHRGRGTMNIKGSPLRTLTGEVIGAVLALEDVTERVKLERIARQSEKMAAVGSLAAGIAHEINNPIGVITSRVELILMEAREKGLQPGVTRDLRVIEKHAGRVAKITQGLLSFSRQAPWKLTDMDVNQVVEEALLLVEKQFTKERIVLEKNLAAGLPQIAGSPNHLEQVLVNLLTNAREAMVGGGTVLVESRRAHEMIEIRVMDTGPGIPPEVMARIFDPFFTTKEEGTGLGLSISYGIVREHGGTITIESRPGGGSTFIIQLPIRATSTEEGTLHGERAHPRHR